MFLKKVRVREVTRVKIIVYIKQVADSEARILVRGDHTSLEIENKYAMNFFDEFAVEEALRIKEKGQGEHRHRSLLRPPEGHRGLTDRHRHGSGQGRTDE